MLTDFQQKYDGEKAFQFMDGSGYDASGNVVPKPLRYTAPAAPIAPAPTVPTSPTFNAIQRPNEPAPVDENLIREETRKRMQTQVDAINAEFTNLISRENIAGEDRSGQTRAINSRSGLMGSDFGAAQATKTTQFNQQQVKALEDEKAAKIGAVLANIENRASAEIQVKKQEALGKYQMDMAQYEQAQEQARADLKILAQSGADLNGLNPAQKAALLKQAGYEGDFGELIFNAMKPKASQIDYKFEKLADGKGLFYGIDPTTGELVTKNVEMDIPDDMQLTIAPDGTPILFNKTTGQAQVADGFGQGQFAKPEEADKLYGGLSKEQRTELQRIQGNVRQDPDVKDFVQIRDGYERVQTGANLNNAQGDLSLLFGFMKILDPNSVVRETEFANAEQAQGTLQRFFNIPDKFIKGTRLTEEGRKYFAEAAQELYQRKEMSYQKASDFYGGQLDAFEIPRELGLRDFGTTFDDNQSAELTPITGPVSPFSPKLLQKYPYQEVAQFIKQYPDATEAEIKELVGFNSVGNTSASAYKSFDDYSKKVGMGKTVSGSQYHTGNEVDIDGKVGDPIPAYKGGKVVEVIDQGKTGYGKKVVIEDAQGNRTIYGHLSSFNVKVGQYVKSGQPIGKMGNTGNVVAMGGGDGSHLHIEMRDKNNRVIALGSNPHKNHA